MPTLAIAFPMIDPVALQLGPFALRWYALAYMAGILFSWRYARFLANRSPQPVAMQRFDDFLIWATFGIILGGRLGYVLFYKPAFYLAHPLEIPQMWHGGMSFHGGMLGVFIAIILFTYKHRISLAAFCDILAVTAPVGLFFGRVANFINGELWGRVTTAPWGMIFPHGGPLPRHPSQLYQAGLEGLCLFLLVLILEWRGGRRRPGLLTGAFLLGYGAARMVGELFREPDEFLGFLAGGLTMGQILSLPMAILGAALILRASHRPAHG